MKAKERSIIQRTYDALNAVVGHSHLMVHRESLDEAKPYT